MQSTVVRRPCRTRRDKESPKRDSRAEVARERKIPRRKLQAAAEVKKASPELAQKVRDGAMPLATARREIKRATILKNL